MKIAGVQMDVELGNIKHNLNRIAAFTSEAAEQGAELIVFPECVSTGYCFESLEEANSYAEAIPGSSIERVHAICSEHQVHVVFGLLERAGENLFNACACMGPSGLIGTYRKVHLPALGVDHFTTPGDRPFAVHAVGEANIGMNICYDASFPEASRVMALDGADLIVLPTNWPPGAEPTADYVINARASENKVFFIAVNRVGMERGFGFIGKSKICDVHGNNLAMADHTRETIIYADIDPHDARNKRIERVPGKHSIDRFADRRPEMYGRLLDPKQ
jgi:predicted amidohydrolase